MTQRLDNVLWWLTRDTPVNTVHAYIYICKFMVYNEIVYTEGHVLKKKVLVLIAFLGYKQFIFCNFIALLILLKSIQFVVTVS